MIYLTGESGFLGSSLKKWFFLKGKDLISINRHELKNIENVPYINIDNEENTLIHCAWAGVLGKYRNNEDMQKNNFFISDQVNKLIKELNIKKLIAFGSQAEYGSPNELVDELSFLNPTTDYGRAKILIHEKFKEIANQNSIKLIWLRLFDPYGPGDNPHWFLPYIIRCALRDISPEISECEQMWDFIYIDDVCRCIEKIEKHPFLKSDFFNLSSNKVSKLKDLVEFIFDEIKPKSARPLYGKKPFRKDQVFYLRGSNDKLCNEINWNPKVNIYEGLRNTINYERKKMEI